MTSIQFVAPKVSQKFSENKRACRKDTYGWKGILDYIKAEITDPAMRKLATSRVIESAKTRKNHLAAGRYVENFGGYPMMYVFKAILAGTYKRAIQPCKKPTKEEIAYEKRAAEVQ